MATHRWRPNYRRHTSGLLLPDRRIVDPLRRGGEQHGLPGYPCCCPSASSCGCTCSACSDTAPCCWRVDIAGMADNTCSECENFNGTWYLSQDTAGGCTWSVRIPTGCTECDSVDLVLTVHLDGSDYKIKVEMVDDSDTVLHKWEKNYGEAAPDCCGLSSESLPHVTNSGDCDSSSATCTITAADNNACEAACAGGCDACIDGDVPVLVQATISGLVNDQCDGCSNGNGTWTLEYMGNQVDGCVLSNACLWRYAADDPDLCSNAAGGFGSCSGISVEFELKQADATDYSWALTVSHNGCTESTVCYGARWYRQTTPGGDIDCKNISIANDDWDSSNSIWSGCDPSSATATVEALA